MSSPALAVVNNIFEIRLVDIGPDPTTLLQMVESIQTIQSKIIAYLVP